MWRYRSSTEASGIRSQLNANISPSLSLGLRTETHGGKFVSFYRQRSQVIETTELLASLFNAKVKLPVEYFTPSFHFIVILM